MIARDGVTVAESTLGDWVRRSADLLKPLSGLMHRRVLLSRVIRTDDTRSRYAEPGRDTMPNGHFWVAIGDAAPFTVFDFTTGYSADEGPVRCFAGFRGYLRDVLPALHALGDTPTPEQLGHLLPGTWASQRPSANPPARPAA